MTDEGAVLVQYVFLDVVRFTQGRSVEAQVDIVKALNEIVRESIEDCKIAVTDRIFLPTGDGMAIAILRPQPFDIGLTTAQKILARLYSYNLSTEDPKRRFNVRIGINQNIDSIVIDINGAANVAGRGINMAQRIMSHADGGQILMGDMVYDILCEREAYLKSFRRYTGRDKHGNSFLLYQFVTTSDGINCDVPSSLKPREESRQNMEEYAAHFIANAVRHKEFLHTKRLESGFEYTSVVLLHFLALDSADNMNRNPLQERKDRAQQHSKSLQSTYELISSSYFWIRAEFHSEITDKLWGVRDCFEQGKPYGTFWSFPSEVGLRRVQEEHPGIWSSVIIESNDLHPEKL